MADTFPTFELSGNGSGRWGTLTVASDGRLGTPWINLPLDPAWSVTDGYARYRKIGSVVYVEFNLTRGAGGVTGPDLLTTALPAEYWPSFLGAPSPVYLSLGTGWVDDTRWFRVSFEPSGKLRGGALNSGASATRKFSGFWLVD
jgi:hypothetical protein